jgi:hypothetical protein
MRFNASGAKVPLPTVVSSIHYLGTSLLQPLS